MARSIHSLVFLAEIAPDGQAASHLILMFLLRRMARSLCRDGVGWPDHLPFLIVVNSSGSTWLWLFGRSFRYVRLLLLLRRMATRSLLELCSGALGALLRSAMRSALVVACCLSHSHSCRTYRLLHTDNFFIMLELTTLRDATEILHQ